MIENDIFNTLKPSASMSISKMAEALKKKGETVYSLSIGDTHFPPPKLIRNRLINAVQDGKTHYTEAQGVFEFREVISAYYDEIYSPDEIIISSGLKEALYILLLSLAVKKVCVLEPAWLGYQATCVLTGKECISINYYDPNWLSHLKAIDFDAVLICSPNNPDGKIFDRSTALLLKEIIQQKNAYIIIDEIYRIYDYRDEVTNAMKIFYGEDKAIIANGLSKSHAMTGLRIGFLLSTNKALISRMIMVQQNLSTCANSLGQYAGIGFTEALDDVTEYKNYYKQNRDIVIQSIPELKPFLPDGGFYFFFDLKVFKKQDADEFCKKLLIEEKIGLVPGSAYGKSFTDWVRLSFSIDKEQLKKALIKLNRYLKKEK